MLWIFGGRLRTLLLKLMDTQSSNKENYLVRHGIDLELFS